MLASAAQTKEWFGPEELIMRTIVRGWLGVLLFLGMASPAHAQIEPEAWTILKIALNDNPPTPARAVMMLVKYDSPDSRGKLVKTWLGSLAKKAPGTAAEKRKKMDAMLGAFEGSFAAGNGAKQAARAFLALRDELLARKTPPKEIERSASTFVDRLRALPEADRRVLQEFGRLARRNIQNVVVE
jgi:hypothetical protein